MNFEQSELSRSIEQSQLNDDEVIERLTRHMDDCDIAMRRENILDIVEDNINQNGTVSIYDIARVREIAPQSSLAAMGSDVEVAAALNAISSDKSTIFRLIISLLLGVAGISMMVYGFIQDNKDRQATIDSIRSSTEAIKKNAATFKTTTISLNDTPVVTDEVIKLYGEIKESWMKIAGPDAKPLTQSPLEFIKTPEYPISQKTAQINRVMQNKIWRGDVGDIKRLNGAVKSIASDLAATSNKVEKWFDAFLEHMTKGNPLPRQFPDFIEALYIKNPFTGKESYPGGVLEDLLTASQTAWPLRYPESSLTKAAQAELTAAKTAYSLDFILKGSGAAIADACTYALEMGTDSADNIKAISELSTKIATRLKVSEDKSKSSLEKLEGMERGDYKVQLTKIRSELNAFNKLNEALDRTIVNGIAVSKQVDSFLRQVKHYDDLVSKMRFAAYKAAAEKKAAGNNSIGHTFGLNRFDDETTWVDDAVAQLATNPTPVTDDNPNEPTGIANAFDEAGLDHYLEEAELEISTAEKLRDIADRLSETGTISRADVSEIEAAAPGLLSYMGEQPNFTFRPSTIGLEPALNAIGSRISAKGGIIAAIIAAIIAVIGYIISKIFGGAKGTGKEVGGIQTPPPEVKAIVEQSAQVITKALDEAKSNFNVKLERRRVEAQREREEVRARGNAEEVGQAEAKAKKLQAEWDRKGREDRVRDPSSAGYGDVVNENNKAYIYSVDKTDAHLPEKVLNAYNEVVRLTLRNGARELPFIKDYCMSFMVGKKPSIFAFESPSNVEEYYNSFVYAPDALTRIKRACGLCDGVGERILNVSDLSADAHRKAVKFWSMKPREFRSMNDFNQAMANSGLGEAMAKVKELAAQLEEDIKAISPVRAELKFKFIDTTKPDAMLYADPIPKSLDSLKSEYGMDSLPKSIFKFRDSMNEINKKMDEEERHQSYDGGTRKNGGFYLADNVYGSAGLSGKGSGRGVDLELRKELMGAGMPAEVFAAIARVEREQVDFVNQAHRKIQGAVNSTAYVIGDMRRYYEAAVSLSRKNVTYQEKLAALIKAFTEEG